MGNDNDYWDDEYFLTHYDSEYSGGTNCSGGCTGDIFKFALIAVGVIIVLALLLGVEMNAAVVGFLFKVLLVTGWFAFLGFIFGEKR